ncbi:MAG: hypothetical protein QOH90_451 [Actinomycetota bacterium]|jgi:uncharacterized protein YkwD|nr:hypothetical protein [Actinomycetota bacterium]
MKLTKILAVATLSATLTALSLPALPALAATTSCWSLYNTEGAMKRETNTSRQNHGRARLPLDQELSKVARLHSQQMAKAGYAFHTKGAQFESLITGNWTVVHENVGSAQVINADPTYDITRLQTEFMASPTHRENILTAGSDYMGVGVVRKNGYLYVTVLFVEGGNPGTSLRVPTC